MRLSTRSRHYICLPCRLRVDRDSFATKTICSTACAIRKSSSQAHPPNNTTVVPEHSPVPINEFPRSSLHLSHKVDSSTHHSFSKEQAQLHPIVSHRVNNHDSDSLDKGRKKHGSTYRRQNFSRNYATSSEQEIELSEEQRNKLKVAQELRIRLTNGLKTLPTVKNRASPADTLEVDAVLRQIPKRNMPPSEKKLFETLGNVYAGRPYTQLKSDLSLAVHHRSFSKRMVSSDKTKTVLSQIGVLDDSAEGHGPFVSLSGDQDLTKINSASDSRSTITSHPPSLAAMIKPEPKTKRPSSAGSTARPWTKSPSTAAIGTKSQTLGAKDLILEPLGATDQHKPPQLSFDLSRVLFNPGVYQLRDPRSRVYNFDPYLEHIMPISEFNFEALNPYLTSSEDVELLDLAQANDKRYIGSSSSMTSAMSQFHFLISQWRELNVDNLTRGFGEGLRNFTAINRKPSAIFLRYKDGIYAVDSDKEYDEPNVLLSLGKSLEKLLTLEKNEFEKWRKTAVPSDPSKLETSREAFHYSSQGRFLLRSQLDAWDPRLPGTGYFDLKTRAVAGVRMNLREYEDGAGYQIKERFGTWESYEREYFDMMRSTFLKYSLQARMGRMDGIFVAYHNIARMFGFQYVPMSEMDLTLHGQTDPAIGDQEFRFSIKFMEEIFNMATETFPQQSMRVHFETREASVTEPNPYMQIFIEPMAEDEIVSIQSHSKAQFEKFERKLLHGNEAEAALELESQVERPAGETTSDQEATGPPQTASVFKTDNGSVASAQSKSGSSAANTQFLNDLLNVAPDTVTTPSLRDVLGLRLSIQNKVNDRSVDRPENITSVERWTIDYKLEKMPEDVARRMYTFCKSRRMAALKTIMNRGPDDYFLRTIRQMNAGGAEWRKQQDELDAQRETVVLYQDKR